MDTTTLETSSVRQKHWMIDENLIIMEKKRKVRNELHDLSEQQLQIFLYICKMNEQKRQAKAYIN